MASLAGVLRKSAAARPARTALIAGQRSVNYAELDRRAARAAAAMADLGVRRGDRVALLLGTVPEFVEALHGAWRLGAVVAPLNVMLTPEEAGYVLADADARLVVADRSLVPAVLAVRDRLAGLEQILVTGSRPSPRRTSSWERALRRAEDPPQVSVEEDDQIGRASCRERV